MGDDDELKALRAALAEAEMRAQTAEEVSRTPPTPALSSHGLTQCYLQQLSKLGYATRQSVPAEAPPLRVG